MDKKIILTGDRPTGRLHLGHYVGSLQSRVALQDAGGYDKFYVMIADSQGLTDNAKNPQKLRSNILEVLKDYIAVGLDPKKCIFFLQSAVSELCELTFYYLNLVTVSRLNRNPTVKEEIKQRFIKTFMAESVSLKRGQAREDNSIPAGFLIYPVSQAADITAFDASIVPVGEDQKPMLEQAREIVRAFNQIYGDTLVEPQELLAAKNCRRLRGIDGNAKMSKSLNNCIYLSETAESLKTKVMSMYTDPNHIKAEDKGTTKGNTVFEYLEIFANDEHFKKYLPYYKNLAALKAHYERGGLGDVKVKKFLLAVLEELLAPIRARRAALEGKESELKQILKDGTKKACKHAAATLERVRDSIGLNFLD